MATMSNKSSGESFLGKFYYLAVKDSKFPYRTMNDWLAFVNKLNPNFVESLGKAINDTNLQGKMSDVAKNALDSMQGSWFSKGVGYPAKATDLQIFVTEFGKFASSFGQVMSKFKQSTMVSVESGMKKITETAESVASSAATAAKIAPWIYLLVPAAIIGFWIYRFMPKKKPNPRRRRICR